MAGYLSGLGNWAVDAPPSGSVQPRPRQPFERGQRPDHATRLNWAEDLTVAQPATDSSGPVQFAADPSIPVQAILVRPFQSDAPSVTRTLSSIPSPIPEGLFPERPHPNMPQSISSAPPQVEPGHALPAVQFREAPPTSALPPSALPRVPANFNLPLPPLAAPPNQTQPAEAAPMSPVALRRPVQPLLVAQQPVGELRPQMPTSSPQSSRLERATAELAPPEPPRIQVTIGRLEVRLSSSAAPAPVRPSVPIPSGPSLGDYLQGRDRRKP